MKHRITVAVVALTVLLAACSSEASPPTTPIPSTVATATEAAPDPFPVQVPHEEGVAELASRPQRIAALSGTHVEMLFAIGAGPQVIAGDLFSTYPPDEVENLQLIDSFNLSVEAVIDLQPDLVVLSFDPGNVVAALEAVNIPTMLFETAHSLEDVYRQIDALGKASGRVTEADQLIAEMQEAVESIVEAASGRTSGVSFYHESDPFSYYTPNSSSFVGGLYQLLGMTNIADEAPDEFDSGFPQLSAEFIVASDPDVIFLAGVGETAETIVERAGWDTMSAVQSGNVVVLDYDTASRWGPRVVDLLEAIAAGVDPDGSR